MMNDRVRTITPVDGSVYVERPFASRNDAVRAADRAGVAHREWRRVPTTERIGLVSRALEYFDVNRAAICDELTWQMGRPSAQAPGELDGLAERASYMLGIAEEALADLRPLGSTKGLSIRREPVGNVLAITPWNFPFLTAVNVIVPALAAGNCVLLKPSPQTPLAGERFADAFASAGVPDGVFQCLHMSPETTTDVIRSGDIQHVAFTGSDRNGALVEAAAAGRNLGVGLELGGKDAAYVRADADLDRAVAGLVDGTFFNAGQSCCSVERIYVHRSLYADFVEAFAAAVARLRPGHPLDPGTNLGPVVSRQACRRIREEIGRACEAGARDVVAHAGARGDANSGTYLAPSVLVDVHHGMPIMRDETFGPVVGVMCVDGDAQATELINDSEYGLTASIWTADPDAVLAIGGSLAVGTVFMNRCDTLHPALAWSGTKCSGRGCTLSAYGYDALTRPKSFNLEAA